MSERVKFASQVDAELLGKVRQIGDKAQKPELKG